MTELLTVKTSGTDSIAVDLASATRIPLTSKIKVSGSAVLIGNYAIAPTGTPQLNAEIEIEWQASVTPGAFSVTIYGQVVPAHLLTKEFIARATYDGSAWDVYFLVDRSSLIALTELANLTSAYIIVGNASNIPTAVAMSGDATISNAGVIAIGSSKVLNAMINTMDAAKLTGTIAAARIADASLASTVLSDVGLLDSKYSDTATTAVVTAEILYSYTVPGGTFANNGEGIEVIIYGSFAANANTKSVVVKFGSNTYATNAVTTAPNGIQFSVKFEVLRSGATSAVGFGEMVVGAVNQGVAVSKGGITWANDTDVSVIGTNGTAAANDIVVSQVVVKMIR